MRKTYFMVAAAALAGVGLYQQIGTSPAVAQSGSRAGASQARRPGKTFEGRFWNWLQEAQYRNWAPVPGQGAGAYPGKSPHGKFLKMYLNRTAVANMKTLPMGSVIVKENYGPDQKTLMAVTVMYRSKGYDPEHFDWYWVKYTPQGMVAHTPPEMGNMPISGRFKSCIGCHGGADGNDFAFAND